MCCFQPPPLPPSVVAEGCGLLSGADQQLLHSLRQAMTSLAQQRTQQVSPKHDWMISEDSAMYIHCRNNQRHWLGLLHLNSTNITFTYHHHHCHHHRHHDCTLYITV